MKSSSSRIFIWLFLLAGFAEILGQMLDFPYPQKATKPFIIPFLAAYLLSKYGFQSKLVKWLCVALFFSWLGDYMYIFEEDSKTYLLLGLGAFFLALLTYTYIFRSLSVLNTQTTLSSPQKLKYLFILGLALTGVYSVLYPVLGSLKFPIGFYLLGVLVMLISALYRYGRTSTLSFGLTIAGAILFFVSNSILAVNRFIEPIPWSGGWGMVTYVGAQYFMGEGLMQHLKLKSDPVT